MQERRLKAWVSCRRQQLHEGSQAATLAQRSQLANLRWSCASQVIAPQAQMHCRVTIQEEGCATHELQATADVMPTEWQSLLKLANEPASDGAAPAK